MERRLVSAERQVGRKRAILSEESRGPSGHPIHTSEQGFVRLWGSNTPYACTLEIGGPSGPESTGIDGRGNIPLTQPTA